MSPNASPTNGSSHGSSNGPSNGSRPSPVAVAEVAGVRQPTVTASLLPPRVYHDPEVLAYELESWFANGWVCVGREEDIELTGQYFLTKLCDENLIILRDKDHIIRGFFNFCRHRGATLVTEPTGRIPRFQCPYHAWVYDLDGTLHKPRHTDLLENFDLGEWGLVPVALDVWQGMIFVNISGNAGTLASYLDDMPAYFERYDLAGLRRAKQIDYDVKANWKAIIENYSECYHCPGVHPQLNRITPYNLGEWIPTSGPWRASWMPVTGDHDTLTMDGQLHGRDFIGGTTEEDHKKIYYFVVWPNMLVSLHPDYLMTHRLVPLAPDRTSIACEWFFEPESMAKPDFDPSDAIDFWDLTNRQDWEVCELQQEGTRSRAYTAGRFTTMEGGVHNFDAKVADRYANDGIVTPLEEIQKADAGDNLAGRKRAAMPAD
jgi:glycine betaine catabolism A